MEDLNKLKWRCRRGTLELDIMFQRYLSQCYQQANQSEQQAFLQLLSLEDSELIHFMMGNSTPESLSLAELVNKIRNLTVMKKLSSPRKMKALHSE